MKNTIRWLSYISVACALHLPSYAAQESDSLAAYWPMTGDGREWSLVGADSAHGAPRGNTTMRVTAKGAGPKQVELWFSNKPGQAPGASDVERYELCDAPGGDAWLFLDAYFDAVGGRIEKRHPVNASRILFTPDDGKPVDLIANGTYARCGGRGQPYLLWDSALAKYRIQVWGGLDENRRFRWYWDATVYRPAPVTNTCIQPPNTVDAVRVREAWWSNFKDPHGKWGLGSGDLGPDGTPTGTNVRPGRTVWHAKGQTPYYLIGPGDGGRFGSCTLQ